MKQVVIISGKGGTGKTTVTAALADLAAQEMHLMLADADVDAANLELLLQPQLVSQTPFIGGKLAQIDQQTCTPCGTCAEVCRFDAVRFNGHYLIDPKVCEGCLSCFYQCPSDAITIKEHQSGEWYQSETDWGTLFHANLKPGEENSGKLVTEILEHAQQAAQNSGIDLLLVDGPPGIGCPVTAACRSADLAVVVSEPTVSGQHDLERVLQLTRYFKLSTLLVLNKANLSQKMHDEMLAFAREEKVDLLGEIPYDESAMQALFTAQPITRLEGHALNDSLASIWQRLKEYIE